MVKFLFLRHRNRKMIGFTRPIRALCAVSPLPPYRASLGVLLLCLLGSSPCFAVEMLCIIFMVSSSFPLLFSGSTSLVLFRSIYGFLLRCALNS